MRKAKIMIVEDEGLVALEIKEALEKMDYEVTFLVSSGEEAIEKVMIKQPDLVLMDIRLEGEMDGVETAKQIRDRFFIPVIYLTAHSEEKIIQKAKVTESYGYIIKPFEDRTLKATIEMALYKAEKEREDDTYKTLVSDVLSNIYDGIIVTDINGYIKLINKEASNILLYNQTEVIGKHISDVFTLLDQETRKANEIPLHYPFKYSSMLYKHNYILVNQEHAEFNIDLTIAPLRNKNNDIIGLAIVFINIQTKHLFDQEIKKELQKPKKFQVDLLPQKDKIINNITINWLFYPSYFGSGDFFNFFKLDNNHVGFYLLDVMGHGFSAAVLSISLYNFLSYDIEKLGILKRYQTHELQQAKRHKQVRPQIVMPAEVIDELNKRFYFKLNDYPFFSLVYGIINTQTGQGVLARGGHEYPYLQKKDGTIFSLESEGSAIGLFPDMRVTEIKFDFKKGDRIILFSDGLVDLTNNRKEQFTKTRLKNFLIKNQKNTTKELITKLDKIIQNWKGEQQFRDDIALLVLEYK